MERLLTHVGFNNPPTKGLRPLAFLTKSEPDLGTYHICMESLAPYGEAEVSHLVEIGAYYEVMDPVSIAANQWLWLADDGSCWIADKVNPGHDHTKRQIFPRSGKAGAELPTAFERKQFQSLLPD